MAPAYTLGKAMGSLDRVRAELARQEYLLLKFAAREGAGGVDPPVRLKRPVAGAHEHAAAVHERGIAHPRFPWTFQNFLHGCTHGYPRELFPRNPRMKGGR